MNASTPSTPTSIDWRLAKHATGVQYADLSAHTVNRIATFVADTLSVGMAGSAVTEAQTLHQSLAAHDANPSTTVWGTGQTLSTPNAIMANAFNVHCQEFDCVHEGAVVHAMATLLPVLMAEVEQRHHNARAVTGQELCTAVAAGINVACTLGLAASQAMQFFRPATAGGFGAVAALARLRNYSAAQLVSAWGFQLAQTSGTMQGHREGSPVLPLQVSFNARAAWQACELANSGLASLSAPITGSNGYLAMFEVESAIPPLVDTLGHVWRIDEFSHKPYPSGRATHAGIEALIQLMHQHALSAEQIQAVHVVGPSLISRLVNRPALASPSPNYARLCMPYVLAKVMQHGQLLPDHYSQAQLNDPASFELAQRVSMTVDDNPDPNAFTPVTVRVALIDGTEHELVIDHMLASPKRPLSEQQCADKFNQCCALAPVSPKQPQTLFNDIMAIDAAADVASLIAQPADLSHH